MFEYKVVLKVQPNSGSAYDGKVEVVLNGNYNSDPFVVSMCRDRRA